jgi:branched-chain amino acid transport system permease protein
VSLNQFMQTLANGLLLGCVYAAFALGLSLVLGILGLVNVAHSAILVLAALVYWQLVNGVGIDPLLAIPLVVAAFFLAGTALESTIVRRIEREPSTTALLVFFGTMVAIESVAVLVWTTDTRTVRPAYLDTVWRFGQIGVPVSRVVTAALTLVLLGGLHLFLTRTLTGAAVRGMAQNRDVAAMVGPRPALQPAGACALAGLGLPDRDRGWAREHAQHPARGPPGRLAGSLRRGAAAVPVCLLRRLHPAGRRPARPP